jgi:hypothetical protein
MTENEDKTVKAVHKDGTIEDVNVGGGVPNDLGQLKAKEEDRVRSLIIATIHAVRTDAPEVWTSLLAEQEKKIEEINARCLEGMTPEKIDFSLLADPAGRLAAKLFEKWGQQRQDLVGLELCQGYCVSELHSWFRVIGDPELLCDPRHYTLIDPMPRGVSVLAADVVARPAALVVEPWSPFQQAYAGKRVGLIETAVAEKQP